MHIYHNNYHIHHSIYHIYHIIWYIYIYIYIVIYIIVTQWDIYCSLSDGNRTWTHNHLVRQQTLNHLAKLASLAKWLSVCLQTKWLWVRFKLQLEFFLILPLPRYGYGCIYQDFFVVTVVSCVKNSDVHYLIKSFGDVCNPDLDFWLFV